MWASLACSGAHVVRRTEHLAWPSDVELRRAVGVLEQGSAFTQVEDLDHRAERAVRLPANQHEIAWLEVAVDQPLFVNRLQAQQRLVDQGDRLAHRQPFRAGQDLFERFTLQVLHHQVMQRLVLAAVIGPHDVGVPYRQGEFDLALEAREHGRLGGLRGRQHLDGNGHSLGVVNGLVDAGHSSLADAFDEPIGAEVELLAVAPSDESDLKFRGDVLGDQPVGELLETRSGASPFLEPAARLGRESAPAARTDSGPSRCRSLLPLSAWRSLEALRNHVC